MDADNHDATRTTAVFSGGQTVRNSPVLLCMAVGAILGMPCRAPGQDTYANVHGMFGDRVMGQSLTPKTQTRLGGGIATGSAGEFLGRGRVEGMRFPDMPWQYPVGVVPLPDVQPRSFANMIPWGLLPRPLPMRASQPSSGEGEAIPIVKPNEVESQPTPAPQPEQWFREPAADANSPTNGGTTVPSAGNAGASQPGKSAFAASLGDSNAAATASFRPGAPMQRLSNVSLTMENDTVVLRGRVATEHDRQLAEILTRFEPGVWQVRNEVTVVPRATSTAALGDR